MDLKIIKAMELGYYLQRQDVYLIDIRPREEYERAHIEGAINVPIDRLERFFSGRNQSGCYILYCERGIASLREGRRLVQRGYRIGTLAGGFSMYERNRKSR